MENDQEGGTELDALMKQNRDIMKNRRKLKVIREINEEYLMIVHLKLWK